MTTPPLYRQLITRQQLQHRGLTQRHLRQELEAENLIQLRKSVFVPSQPWKNAYPSERYLAECYAWAITSQRAVFSHASAAALMGLPLLRIPQDIYCYGPTNSRGSASRVRYYPKLDGATPLIISPPGLTCTSVATTVNDCSRTLDYYSGLVIAESALSQGLLTHQELQEVLDKPGRGVRKSRAVSAHMSQFSESAGESLMLARIREFGYPAPVQQYLVAVPWNGKTYRIDAAYPELKLALEFDGAFKLTGFGPTDQALIKERTREKDLLNLGWTVVRFSWDMVWRRPAELKAILASRLGKNFNQFVH